jgi:hypothetical protein
MVSAGDPRSMNRFVYAFNKRLVLAGLGVPLLKGSRIGR